MEKKELYTVWKSSFEGLAEEQVKESFNTIVKHYEETHRHYHNLTHVRQLIEQINKLLLIKRDRLILIYSAFYHDVIYKVGKTNNEQKSAHFANVCLNKLQVEKSIISSVERTILATANHESENELTQLFLDMDMSILASSKANYNKYTKAIKRENATFPQFLYVIGRKKFVCNTLKKSRIFLTDLYQNRYELIARTNLLRELNTF